MTKRATSHPIDLLVDLQGMDESGLPWGLIDDARKPASIVEGGWIIVGTPRVNAVARVIDVEDGVVHVDPLPGPASKWFHLVDRSTRQSA